MADRNGMEVVDLVVMAIVGFPAMVIFTVFYAPIWIIVTIIAKMSQLLANAWYDEEDTI